MADINLRVVDIYHGDTVTSFQQAADSGIWGIIHKATTGQTGKDSAYPKRRKPALDAGELDLDGLSAFDVPAFLRREG